MTWLQGRGDITYRSQKPLRLRGDVTVAPDGFAIDAMKAEIDGGAVEGRVAVSHRQAAAARGSMRELKAERLDLDAATAFARSLAGPQGEWPEEGAALARYRPRHLGRPGAAAAARQARLLAENVLARQLKIGQPGSVTLEGAGSFDRVNATGKLALNSSAASLGQLDQPDRAVCAGAGRAAQCDGDQPGPGAPEAGARSRQECRACRSRHCARRARSRRAAAQGRHHDHRQAGRRGDPRHRSRRARAQRIHDRLETVVRRRAARLLALLGLDRTVAAGEGPAQFEGSATGAWRAPLRLKAKISGDGLDAEAQGSAEPWAPEAKASVNSESPQRQFRPAARSQAGRYAGAEHRPVLARVAHRQQADLRRSRQHHRRLAAARPPRGDAGRGENHRGRDRRSTRSRWRRPLRWPSAPPDTMPPSRSARGW